MERLLQEEGDLMRSAPRVDAGDFNGNPPGGQELFNRLAAEIEQDNNKMAVDDDNDGDEEDEDEEEDGEEEDEEECSNGSPGDEDQSNNSQLNEEWHSGTRSQAVCFSYIIHHRLWYPSAKSLSLVEKQCFIVRL